VDAVGINPDLAGGCVGWGDTRTIIQSGLPTENDRFVIGQALRHNGDRPGILRHIDRTGRNGLIRLYDINE
jgi:hypothetical protein